LDEYYEKQEEKFGLNVIKTLFYYSHTVKKLKPKTPCFCRISWL